VTGDLLLRAKLKVVAKSNNNTWEDLDFIVDPGAEITTMPAFRARQLDLPMPRTAALGVVHDPTGLEIRSGYLRLRVVGMDQTEYAIPCFFLGDPAAAPPTTGVPASATKNLLGLGGVVDKLRLTFDGDAGPGAAHGHLSVEKR